MCEAKDFPPSERDELMGLVTQLQGQVAQLTAAKEELHEQVAELKRAGKRQAAPFSKGGRSSRPKRPGRKPGMGSFSYRKSPSPDEVTEPLVEVAVAEDTCPGCGGRLEHEGVRVVYARRTVDLGVIGWRDLVEPAGQTPARTRLPASIPLCGAADDDHHGDVVTLACITHKGADMREHAILDVLSRTPQLGTNNLPQPIFVEESLLGLLRLGDAILYRKTTHLPGAM